MTVWGRFAAQVTVWRWSLAIAMLALLVLSLMPASLSPPSMGWDKGNHALGFAVLAFLAHWAWPAHTLKTLSMLLGYGALIEVFQSFTPDRLAEWNDLWADAAGLLIGAVVALVVQGLATKPSTRR